MYEDDDELLDEEESARMQRALAVERHLELALQMAQDEQRASQVDEPPARKRLKRELQAEALSRLEDAARTEAAFQNVVAWWDKLDANRERRERYHEISRSGDDKQSGTSARSGRRCSGGFTGSCCRCWRGARRTARL